MLKSIVLVTVLFASCLLCSEAMATCSWTMLMNTTTADANQVMGNFDCLAPLLNPSFTGIVGIGASSSTYPLEVGGTNGNGIRYSDSTYGVQNFLGAYNGIGITGTLNNVPLALWTNNAERIRIDTSGNVGIGTASPAAKLAVNGDLVVGSAGGPAGPQLYLTNGTSTRSILTISDGNTASVMFAGGNSMNGVVASDMGLTLRVGASFTAPDIGGTTVLTITTGGNVGIGTTSPGYTLHVNGSVAGTSAYYNLSDRRLKKDIVPIKGALEILERLHGVRFQWRKPEERSGGRDLRLPVGKPQIGFIAQDLQKALPEAISVADDGDATMSVAESKVVPVLVEAVKILRQENEELFRKAIADREAEKRLKVEVTGLKTDVAALQSGHSLRTAAR